MENDRRFDIQHQSVLTPEGQIESAGHFSRGVAHKVGHQRISRFIGILALVVAALAVLAIIRGI